MEISHFLGPTRSRRVETGESAVRTCEAIKGRRWESEENVEAQGEGGPKAAEDITPM